MISIIRAIQREIRAIWQRLEKIDVQWRIPRGGVPYRTVMVDVGNELETTQDGCVYYEGVLPSVPSAYDPDTDDSFIDGIARGTLYVNQVAQEGFVLIVNDDRGGFHNCLREGDVVIVGDPVAMPVSGGGTVPVYPVG